MKCLPRHFKENHRWDWTLLKAKVIDRIIVNRPGGNWKKALAQLKPKWIMRLDIVQPKDLNEIFRFVPFL